MKTLPSLKELARNLKKNAVKVPKSVLNTPAPKIKKNWCGCHSELPTDIKWHKMPKGSMFDKVKNEKGNNKYLLAAMTMAVKKVNG